MGCIVAVILITKPISFFFSLFVKKGGGGINSFNFSVAIFFSFFYFNFFFNDGVGWGEL